MSAPDLAAVPGLGPGLGSDADATLADAPTRDRSVHGADDAVVAEAQALLVQRGSLIGRWVVLDRLGAGGMGVVYAAYDPELDRKVAIKLVPRTADQAGATRLIREAQSMARLSHPNVVTVFDVGAIATGVYIAMEHIDGVTLTRWLGERERSLGEILRVFDEAGRGMQAAHAAGLVHRDFKPDNVMIGHDGRVRVLDFGLARPARSFDGEASGRHESSGGWSSASHLELDLTMPGAVMGTPRYMSPEQHLGKGADERSDVYAYCVALWEAVYRARSFSAGSLTELASKVVAGELDAPPSQRGVPRWLRSLLRRGMSTDPALRFASMGELLASLARGREQRMRRVVAGLGLGTLAILGGLAIHRGMQPQPCAGTDAVLDGVWDDTRKVEIEASFDREGKTYTAASWRTVSRELDEYANALVAMRREACEASRVYGTQSDEVMGRRMACLDRRQRRLATLSGALAEGGTATILRAVEAANGLPDLALCADVERLSGGVAPAEDPAVRARVEEVRLELDRAEELGVAGKIEGMRAEVESALEHARATGYGPVIAEALLLQARLFANLSRTDDAVRAALEGLDFAEASGHDHVIVELAIVLVRVEGFVRADFAAADLYARRAKAVLERLGGDKWLELRLLDEQGVVFNAQGRDDEAVALLRQADTLARETGAAGPRRLPIANALASALMGAGRYDEASEVVADAQRIVDEDLGPEHPNAAALYTLLSRLRAEQGRNEEALELLRRARVTFEAALGPEHPNVAATINGIGLVLAASGRDDEAHAAYAEALAILERGSGKRSLAVATTLQNLALLDLKLDHPEAARDEMLRVLEIRQPLLGDIHEGIGYGKDLLGDAYAMLGDDATALRTYREATAVFEAMGDRSRQAYSQAGIARVFVDQREWAKAIEACTHALELQGATTNALDRGQLRFTHARALHGSGAPRAIVDTKLVEARAALEEAGVDGARPLAALEAWAKDRDPRPARSMPP